jgi:hypothetical protein
MPALRPCEPRDCTLLGSSKTPSKSAAPHRCAFRSFPAFLGLDRSRFQFVDLLQEGLEQATSVGAGSLFEFLQRYLTWVRAIVEGSRLTSFDLHRSSHPTARHLSVERIRETASHDLKLARLSREGKRQWQ